MHRSRRVNETTSSFVSSNYAFPDPSLVHSILARSNGFIYLNHLYGRIDWPPPGQLSCVIYNIIYIIYSIHIKVYYLSRAIYVWH